MRKLIICLIAILAVASVSAKEHLSFKGIPIQGTMLSFCQKLKAKGFKEISKDKNETWLKGDFTGKEATIAVEASDDGKNVYNIDVMFESSREWKVLETTYNHFKDLYTKKYGEPSYSEEYNPAQGQSNILLLGALNDGKVSYSSTWELPGGEIFLTIVKSTGIYEGFVGIKYTDTQNHKAKEQKDLEDI